MLKLFVTFSLLLASCGVGAPVYAREMNPRNQSDLLEICQEAIIQYGSGNKTWFDRKTSHLPKIEQLYIRLACSMYARGLVDGMKLERESARSVEHAV